MERSSARNAACWLAAALLATGAATAAVKAPANKDAPKARHKTKPLKALIMTGGGWHDYNRQKKIIADGIGARANVVFEVHQETPKGNALPEIYKNKDWAKGYDVIIHNECYARFSDGKKVDEIVQQQIDAGAASVMIHCAMHTFRSTKTKSWDHLVGVRSNRHGAKFRIDVVTLKSSHPIMKTVPRDWKTKNGELYHTFPLPKTVVLAEGMRNRGDKKGKQACVWTSEYKGVRTFGCTLGHHNQTQQDPVWLDMVTRGLLWACNKLDDQGNPKPGYGPRKK